MSAPPGPVGVLFHEGFGSGASQTLLRLVPELERRGWDLRFYVDRPGRLEDLLREMGQEPDGRRRHVGFSARWLRYPPGPATKLLAMGAWFAGLAGWLRRERPALVHANSLYSLPDALLARSLGIPVYLQLLEMLPSGRKGALARRVVLSAGMKVGAVSDASAKRFIGASEATCEIVRTGVPFPEQATERPDEPDPPVVGTVGWICARKGSDLFVEAARLVQRERPDVEFRMVGPNDDAPGREWGEEVLRRATAQGIVHIPHTDTYAELREWDVMVLPSRFDPYPLVVMEAMSAGVPVVGAAVDGIVEQVAPGTGLLARPEDPADLAAKVLELLADGPRRRGCGQAARAHARDHFTLERQAEQLDAVWRRAIGPA